MTVKWRGYDWRAPSSAWRTTRSALPGVTGRGCQADAADAKKRTRTDFMLGLNGGASETTAKKHPEGFLFVGMITFD